MDPRATLLDSSGFYFKELSIEICALGPSSMLAVPKVP